MVFKLMKYFGGSSSTIQLEPEAVEDLEVITGTFNAEYGRAMSGVVNAITKDGSNKFEGSFHLDFLNMSLETLIFCGFR